MKAWFNKLMGTYLATKHRKLLETLDKPVQTQLDLLQNMIREGASTEYGKAHGMQHIRTSSEFANQLPIVDYEVLKPYVIKMMRGSSDVLWPGQVQWFAKSSGTTSARSKFIPITHENLKGCHFKSSWDSLGFLYEMLPDASVFHRKSLIMGGSLSPYEEYPDTTYGDVSAIMLQHMPAVGRPFYTPDFETALLDDWEEKIARMVQKCVSEDVSFLGGVPTWTIVLFNRILESTGKENMLEIWPNLQAYTHGGVGFDPYRKTFNEFIPSDKFLYQQVYNASEGFFAAQDIPGADDMLLFLDHSVYYEFLPQGEWHSENPVAISIEEVETGVPYAMVITTNAGLWRYTPGDVIQFTSKTPHRIQVIGRTQQYINAFGEEVMIANAEMALAKASSMHSAEVRDYSVAPLYLDGSHRGRHEWIIEFRKAPENIHQFSKDLDTSLRELNSDYDAKRSYDLALENLSIYIAPGGTFEKWLGSKGRLGGQYKVPRLSNDRKYIEEILHFIEKNHR